MTTEISHKLRPGMSQERVLRLTETIATIHSIHLIGWFVSISLQVATSPTRMNTNGTELINRLCGLRRLIPHSGAECGNYCGFKGCENWLIGRFLREVAPASSITNDQVASKPDQVFVENGGMQASRVLYTKHSVEKRILNQVTAQERWSLSLRRRAKVRALSALVKP
jgi:hypothetical protein